MLFFQFFYFLSPFLWFMLFVPMTQLHALYRLQLQCIFPALANWSPALNFPYSHHRIVSSSVIQFHASFIYSGHRSGGDCRPHPQHQRQALSVQDLWLTQTGLGQARELAKHLMQTAKGRQHKRQAHFK